MAILKYYTVLNWAINGLINNKGLIIIKARAINIEYFE
jgi:hypothetical protein